MTRKALLALTVMLAIGTFPAGAHDGKSHVGTAEAETTRVVATPSEETRAREYFTDLPVVTQDGEELRFFSDVLKDRVVLIGLFYLDCKEACPLTIQKLAEVQDLLGAELGQDFLLISITLDPENDTPDLLKDYADKFQAREGWLFLSGRPENVKQIVRRLGHRGENIAAHSTEYFLGNVPLARWTKLAPNLPPEVIAQHFRRMADYSKTP